MRANFVLSGVAVGIKRNVTMTVALVLSTAIALSFVAAAILANTEIDRFRTKYQNSLSIQVYLCTNLSHDSQVTDAATATRANRTPRTITCSKNVHTTDAQRNAIEARLRKDPRVKSFSYISEAQALRIARKQLPSQASQFTKVGIFPASFAVKLKNIKKDYASFVSTYDNVPGVDKVNNQIDTLNSILSLIDGARTLSIGIAIVVLVASILLIANTIQVAAAQRRNETSIMRLVGASRWMTELPFVLEAIIAAALGGLIAIGMAALGKYYVLDNLLGAQTARKVIPNLSANDVLLAGGAGLIVGVVLSALTAFATLRLYVRL